MRSVHAYHTWYRPSLCFCDRKNHSIQNNTTSVDFHEKVSHMSTAAAETEQLLRVVCAPQQLSWCLQRLVLDAFYRSALVAIIIVMKTCPNQDQVDMDQFFD